MLEGVAKAQSRVEAGFTLVELVITIAVLAILLALALPSFSDFRERNALKGAADEVVNQIGNYRFEAVKRNQPVTLSATGANDNWCIGALLGTSLAGCDCQAAAACDVGRFPGEDTAALRGVRLVNAADFQPFTYEPSTGTLTTLGGPYTLTLGSPTASFNYRLEVVVNPLGKATICVPADSRTIAGIGSCP